MCKEINIEDKIKNFMMRAAKFEFFLYNESPDYALPTKTAPKIITGVNWDKVGNRIEEKYKFDEIEKFDFDKYNFKFLLERQPQSLVFDEGNKLKWDSNGEKIESWSALLKNSYARLRNNIAHGNKALFSTMDTTGNASKFIYAADKFIDFIAEDVLGKPCWEDDIFFYD